MYFGTPDEERARRILEIFRAHQSRAGQTLMRDRVKHEFLSDGRWQARDFLAGLQYASDRDWVATVAPNVLRLTERGLLADAPKPDGVRRARRRLAAHDPQAVAPPPSDHGACE